MKEKNKASFFLSPCLWDTLLSVATRARTRARAHTTAVIIICGSELAEKVASIVDVMTAVLGPPRRSLRVQVTLRMRGDVVEIPLTVEAKTASEVATLWH